jgi:cytosine/adenosine deaminase-related metal-dependent hydrolase
VELIERATYTTPDGAVSGRLRLTPAGAVIEPDHGPPPANLLLPGLVNGHDHLHLNAFPRGRRRGPFAHSLDWIDGMRRRIETPAMQRVRSIDAGARAWHGALKNAVAGTTEVVHHDAWLPVFEHPDFPVRVVPSAGWAHSIDLAPSYGPEPAESFAATQADRPWFIHLAEGTDQRARGELRRLADLGCLGGNTRLVHGVGLAGRDLEAARRAGAGLIWCPSSNAYLLGAVADPAGFVDRVALGTDSRLTGARDLLDEMAFAEALGVPPDALWRMLGHARRLCGAAAAPSPGQMADGATLPDGLVVPRRPRVDSPLHGLRRADLTLVFVAGRPVVADAVLEPVFRALGEPSRVCLLDGIRKHVARRALDPLLDSGLREQGLRVVTDRAPSRGLSRVTRRGAPSLRPAHPQPGPPETAALHG